MNSFFARHARRILALAEEARDGLLRRTGFPMNLLG